MQISSGVMLGGMTMRGLVASGGSLPAVPLKLVVGARLDDDNGFDSGSVYVYDLDGTNEVKITASNGTANSYYGISVATGNGKIVVGAPLYNTSTGRVYIYDADGTNEIILNNPFPTTYSDFGGAVAVGSNKVAVGSYRADPAGVNNRGAVYVYDLDGTNRITVTPIDNVANIQFGSTVAIAGDKLVIGCIPVDSYKGAVYVCDLDGSNMIKLVASDRAGSDFFGYSIATDGNKIAVGSILDDDNGNSSGSVYVYNMDGTNEIKITASDGVASQQFGRAVAINENKLAVGAYLGGNPNLGGAVYLYDLDGTNELKISKSAQGGFGSLGGVSLTANKVYVGNGTNYNNVYVYDLDGTLESTITSSDAAGGDQFGISVAVG